MHLILRWAVAAGALWLTMVLGEKLGLRIKLEGVAPAIIAVAALAVANAVIRPIAKLVTMPLSCLTLGLFGFVVNALIFWLVGGTGLVPGFKVEGFWAALFGSVVMGTICGIVNRFIAKNRRREENS